MPIYEYLCRECDDTFEELVFAGREPERCPKCGSKDIDRQMSCFTSASPTLSGPAPSMGGCGGGGGFS